MVACATNKTPKISLEKEYNFFSIGRINIKYENKTYYSNFELKKIGNIILININSPLGSTISQLCINQNDVIINQNNLQYLNTINEFANKIIGTDIPLNNINSWITDYILSNNKIIQNGWEINRSVDNNNNPKKIEISKNNVHIKIIFDKFSKIKLITKQTINSCKDLNSSLI